MVADQSESDATVLDGAEQADLPQRFPQELGTGVAEQFRQERVRIFDLSGSCVEIVIFEPPEIHLHPRVQADLADLFVDAIRAREDGSPRNCQFIVESHSEHLLRRLQPRIAEEELSPEHAALYFVHTEGATTRIEPREVDPFGNISNWPDGFFGDEMADLVARSEAQARRTARAATER